MTHDLTANSVKREINLWNQEMQMYGFIINRNIKLINYILTLKSYRRKTLPGDADHIFTTPSISLLPEKKVARLKLISKTFAVYAKFMRLAVIFMWPILFWKKIMWCFGKCHLNWDKFKTEPLLYRYKLLWPLFKNGGENRIHFFLGTSRHFS